VVLPDHIQVRRMTRTAVANSNCISLSPSLVVRENVDILDAGTRLGHHVRHGVAPPLVMRGCFVPISIGLHAVNFDQYRIYVPSRPFWPLRPFCLFFAFCGRQMTSVFYEGSSGGTITPSVSAGKTWSNSS
jgi:hypothetical protein